MHKVGEQDVAMSAQYAGATTLVFCDGATAVVIDGFFSRPSGLAVVAVPLRPNEARVAAALSEMGLNRARLVLVAHSHYDHALDAPLIARSLGAEIAGSNSTANIVRGQPNRLGEERILILAPGAAITRGQFSITPYLSPHGRPVRYPGVIAAPLSYPAPASAFREGGSYSFLIGWRERNIPVVPSAGDRQGQFSSVRADTVFLGVGGLGKRERWDIEDYWRQTVEATGARTVILIHWDDLTRPLNQPLRPLPRLFDNFDHTLRVLTPLADASGVRLIVPRAYQSFDLSGQTDPRVAGQGAMEPDP